MPDRPRSSRRAYLSTAAATAGILSTTGLSAAGHDPGTSGRRLYMDMWPGSGVTAEDQDYIVSADDEDAAHSDYYNETGTSVTNGGDRISHDSDTAEWRGTLDSSDDVRDIYYYDGTIYTYYVYKDINFEAVEYDGSFDVNTYHGFTIDGHADYTVWLASDTEPIKGNNVESNDYTGTDSTGGYFGGRVDGGKDSFNGYGDIKRVEVDVDSESYFRIRVS